MKYILMLFLITISITLTFVAYAIVRVGSLAEKKFYEQNKGDVKNEKV
ncbi:TPA: hypothetical protein ACGO3M_000493 [Streptococcus suis]